MLIEYTSNIITLCLFKGYILICIQFERIVLDLSFWKDDSSHIPRHLSPLLENLFYLWFNDIQKIVTSITYKLFWIFHFKTCPIRIWNVSLWIEKVAHQWRIIDLRYFTSRLLAFTLNIKLRGDEYKWFSM